MAETTALPLQQASAPAVATLAAPANGTATPGRPAVALPTDAGGTDAPMDPARLFDFLLGDAPDGAVALDAALPGLARAAVRRPAEDAALPVDPLQVILAQMPAQASVSPVALPDGEVPAAFGSLPGISLVPAADGQAPTENAQDPAGLVPLPGAPLPPGARNGITDIARALVADGGATTATGGLVPTLADAAATGFAVAGDAASIPSIVASHVIQTFTMPPSDVSTPTVPAPVLQQPVDPAQGYDEPFGAHVAWLAGQRIGHAEIRVVPEHLGAIDIRLQMDGSTVRAEFHSSQPEVRQALEASFPRLREMLGQQGLQLSHAGVGQGQGGQRQAGDGAPRQGQTGGLTLPQDAGSPLPPDFRRARGLLDVYA